MPPSREFTFAMNEEVQRELEAALGLKAPVRVVFRSERQGRLHGTYLPLTRTVTINLGVELFINSRLSAVNNEVIRTLLHEFRHAHQFDTWDAKRIKRDLDRPYHAQEVEADANSFAEFGVRRWSRLGRVRPKGRTSNLGRLSAAERKVR